MDHDGLTHNQLEALKQVNIRLKNLQDKLLQEAVIIDKDLRARVDDKSDILYDYELEYSLSFRLKEDDLEYQEDDDNIITEIEETIKGISKRPLEEQWSWAGNHNVFAGWDSPMKSDYHCWWYHSLYDHNDVSWTDILRIGEIFSEIHVYYQYIDAEK